MGAPPRLDTRTFRPSVEAQAPAGGWRGRDCAGATGARATWPGLEQRLPEQRALVPETEAPTPRDGPRQQKETLK